eukprot:TRINITY_DN1791_c0_g1_i2.p1 TRINITY_DN1791_c0_g1~~TRINITY_DN1791_c0_g1_i2.p1  ORF type:complete len:240 (+),score=39.23 TRINITY_DN1791_c0_g1_i2:66-785(+)
MEAKSNPPDLTKGHLRDWRRYGIATGVITGITFSVPYFTRQTLPNPEPIGPKARRLAIRALGLATCINMYLAVGITGWAAWYLEADHYKEIVPKIKQKNPAEAIKQWSPFKSAKEKSFAFKDWLKGTYIGVKMQEVAQKSKEATEKQDPQVREQKRLQDEEELRQVGQELDRRLKEWIYKKPTPPPSEEELPTWRQQMLRFDRWFDETKLGKMLKPKDSPTSPSTSSPSSPSSPTPSSS